MRLDPRMCQAAVSFRTSPYLMIQCEKIPGHSGPHESRAYAPYAGVEQPPPFTVPPPGGPETGTVTWITWHQILEHADE